MHKITIFSYFKKYKYSILSLTLISIFKVMILFAIPILTKKIIEIGKSEKIIDKNLIVYFILAVFLLFFINIFQGRFKLSFLVKFTTTESKYYFNKLLSMDMNIINIKGPTYFTGRIRSSISNLFQLVGSFVNGIIVSILTIIISLFFVYNLNFNLFILFALLVPISIFSYKKLNKVLLGKSASLQNISSVCEL